MHSFICDPRFALTTRSAGGVNWHGNHAAGERWHTVGSCGVSGAEGHDQLPPLRLNEHSGSDSTPRQCLNNTSTIIMAVSSCAAAVCLRCGCCGGVSLRHARSVLRRESKNRSNLGVMMHCICSHDVSRKHIGSCKLCEHTWHATWSVRLMTATVHLPEG